MRITDVEPILCEGGPSNWVFVKVSTDEGITGYGDATNWPGEKVVAAAVEDLANYVVGLDPMNVEKLWQRMYRTHYYIGLGGATNSAISGIETALWDIVGKIHGAPVYSLIGGRCHEKLRLYAHCDSGAAGKGLEGVAENAKKMVSMGFKALKTHISYSGEMDDSLRLSGTLDRLTIQNTAKKIETIRNAVGDNIDICIDCGGALTVTSAVRLGRALEPYDLLFFEEPVPPENFEALLAVKKAVKAPICVGERLFTSYDYRRLFEMNAVDIIMPDAVRTGGILQMLKIAALARTYYVPVAPHNPNSPLSTIISAHVCATIPNFLILELYPPYPKVLWADEILSEPIKVKDGYLELPTKPGLGVDLVEEEVAKHPFKRKAFPWLGKPQDKTGSTLLK